MYNNNIATADTMTLPQLENYICDDEVFKFIDENEEVTLGQILRHFSKNRRNFVWGHVVGRVHTMVQEGKLYVNDDRRYSVF